MKNSRFGHTNFDPDSLQISKNCRELFIKLEGEINKLPMCREKNVVLTKLEEAFMWTNKTIREAQLDRMQIDKKATVFKAVPTIVKR